VDPRLPFVYTTSIYAAMPHVLTEGSWHESRLHTVQEFPLEDLAALFVCGSRFTQINPLNAELNPICYLVALLGTHNFLHVSRI